MGAPKAYTATRIHNVDDDTVLVDFLELEESADLGDVSGTHLRSLVAALGLQQSRDDGDIKRFNTVMSWVTSNLEPGESYVIEAMKMEHESGDAGNEAGTESGDGVPDDGDTDGDGEAVAQSDGEPSGDAGDGEPSDGEADADGDGESDGDGDGDGDGPEVAVMVSVDQAPVWVGRDDFVAMFKLGEVSAETSGEAPPKLPKFGEAESGSDDGKTYEGEHPEHELMPEALAALATGQHLYLWGEKGSGKSTAAYTYAGRTGQDLHAVSAHPHMTRSELVGYMLPTGPFHGPLALSMHDDGVMLVDEADNMPPQAGTVVNMATANRHCAGVEGLIAAQDGWRMILTANTNGQGATTEFVGRFKLDAATLDRFYSIHWYTDYKFERYLVKRKILHGNHTVADEWLDLCHMMRKNIADNGLKVGVSMRSVLDGAKALQIQATPEYKRSKLKVLSMIELARGRVLAKVNDDQAIKILGK